MPAKKSSDPLRVVTVRLPESVLALLQSETSDRFTLSDALRNRLNLGTVEPLFKRRPSMRKPKPDVVGGVSRADPLLIRQLAAIGSNVNQVARTLNTHVVAGTSVSQIELLVVLANIDKSLSTLTSAAETLSNFSPTQE